MYIKGFSSSLHFVLSEALAALLRAALKAAALKAASV